MKWNQFWEDFQEDVLGGNFSSKSETPAVWNTFYQATADLILDLTPSFSAMRKEISSINKDLTMDLDHHLEYICSISEYLEKQRQFKTDSFKLLEKRYSNYDENTQNSYIEYYLQEYNRYAEYATKLRNYARNDRDLIVWAKWIPIFHKISYNSDDFGVYENNIRWSKRTTSKNIYQISSIYRNRVRTFGNLLVGMKSYLVRDVHDSLITYLPNKFIYSPKFVATIYNKRHIFSF